MNYPKDFPQHLKPLVDAAFSEAEIEFTTLRKDAHTWAIDEIERLIKRYIRRVFLAFAEAACRAREEGLWSGETVRKECDRYLHALTEYVYGKKHPTPWNQGAMFAVDRAVRTQVEDSDNWLKIQTRLKQVAELPSHPTAASERLRSEISPPLHIKSPRHFKEPHPELLDKAETLNRKQAAEALGVTERTLDRWVTDTKIVPVGPGSRKRFKSKDLLRLLNKKQARQSRQD